MAKFKPYNYNQTIMIPVCLTEQLMPGTLEHAIHHVVESRIDMSIFNARYQNDDTGAPAFDPKILLKVVLLGFARGQLSSRKIENACRSNILFMALACGQTPDYTTIANFISSMQAEILPIFRDVLLVCDEEGLLGGTRFAADGCKLPGNASQQWSGTFEQLRHKKEHLEKKIQQSLEEHQLQDAEDENADSAAETTAPKKVEKLQNQLEKLESWLASNEPKPGQKQAENKSNLTDNDSAQLVTSHGTFQGYNAQALVDSKCQVIVHAEAVGNGHDGENLAILVEGAKANVQALGHEADYFANAEMLGDSSYFSETNLKTCAVEELNAYIPDTNFRKRDPRFSEDAVPKFSPAEFEYQADSDTYLCRNGKTLKLKDRHRKRGQTFYRLYVANKHDCRGCPWRSQCLATEKTQSRYLYVFADPEAARLAMAMYKKFATPSGRAVYDQRMGIVEPVFANIRIHKGCDRFWLRGKVKVNVQWLLYCLVHNIEKIMNYGSEKAFCPA